jgi:hypothetical protein
MTEINIVLTSERLISDRAAAIKDKIKDGYLYGKPIDMTNPNHLIVAAWLICEQEQMKEKITALDILSSISKASFK